MSLLRFFKSFKWAWQGLKLTFRTEQNFKLELLGFIFVVLLGFFFKISKEEFIYIVCVSSLVLFAELINTAIERITDLTVDKRKTGFARQAKDIGAAAVLILSLNAIIIGCIIFIPRILLFFYKL
jgi:diacylglycerol kinase